MCIHRTKFPSVFMFFVAIFAVLVLIANLNIAANNMGNLNNPRISDRQLAAIALGEIGLSVSHAVEVHGISEVSLIKNCLVGDKGTILRFSKIGWFSQDERIGFACELSPGYWGIYIAKKIGEKWEEVTAFIRRLPNGTEIFTEQEVIDYMISNSWKLIR